MKCFLVSAYLRSGAQDGGSWEDNKSTACWGFLMADYCQSFWIYSLWLLFKRLWMSMALTWFDGPINAASALDSDMHIIDSAPCKLCVQ